MNIRQKQAVYLCPLCYGEDQSFSSGQGDHFCSMYCHNCGHSIGNVIPGQTAYGLLNPRVQVTTGRYVRPAAPVPPMKTREQVQRERVARDYENRIKTLELDKIKRHKEYIEMMGLMDVIKPPEGTRWDDIA